MAKDAKGHGSEKRGGMSATEEAQNRSGIAWGAARAKWHDPSSPDYIAPAAHQAGTDAASKGLFTDAQIAALKEGYAKIKSVDPIQPSYGRMTALLDRASPAQLKQLAGADIKFVSPLAGNRARQSGKRI